MITIIMITNFSENFNIRKKKTGPPTDLLDKQLMQHLTNKQLQ